MKLIKIEEAETPEDWLVWMDAWCVRFRSYAEAESFVRYSAGRSKRKIPSHSSRWATCRDWGKFAINKGTPHPTSCLGLSRSNAPSEKSPALCS